MLWRGNLDGLYSFWCPFSPYLWSMFRFLSFSLSNIFLFFNKTIISKKNSTNSKQSTLFTNQTYELSLLSFLNTTTYSWAWSNLFRTARLNTKPSIWRTSSSIMRMISIEKYKLTILARNIYSSYLCGLQLVVDK